MHEEFEEAFGHKGLPDGVPIESDPTNPNVKRADGFHGLLVVQVAWDLYSY